MRQTVGGCTALPDQTEAKSKQSSPWQRLPAKIMGRISVGVQWTPSQSLPRAGLGQAQSSNVMPAGISHEDATFEALQLVLLMPCIVQRLVAHLQRTMGSCRCLCIARAATPSWYDKLSALCRTATSITKQMPSESTIEPPLASSRIRMYGAIS